MVSRNNDINRIDSPIEMAIRMLEANQEDVFNSIIGPEPAPRKFGKINGQDVDSVLDQVVRNAQLMGQQQQSVTAPPPIETPTPTTKPVRRPRVPRFLSNHELFFLSWSSSFTIED